MNDTLLEIRHLKQYFTPNPNIVIKAVDDVSFTVKRGEILGLVGESGSGKSTVSKCIMGIHRPTDGEIVFQSHTISKRCVYRKIRTSVCRSIQMIFQDAFASMNPRMTIGEIVAEPLRIYYPQMPSNERKQRVHHLLKTAGMDSTCYDRYPHEFSGGQHQRICIARALALKPQLLIADEPVASLDVSMQAQIINLLLQLQREQGLTCLFIAHDLSVVRHICDRIGVMKDGKLVEIAQTEKLFTNPQHPYTKALLSAVPLSPLNNPE